jgi:hypothetical protein
MCYCEYISFLTCGHKIKTTTYCASFIRYEFKKFGPPSQRVQVGSTDFVTFPFRLCHFGEGDDITVTALCPECNDEEFERYGWSSRDFVDYHLGLDAFYTNVGHDGRGRKKKKLGQDEPKNGSLIKRHIEGVTWQYDGSYDYAAYHQDHGVRCPQLTQLFLMHENLIILATSEVNLEDGCGTLSGYWNLSFDADDLKKAPFFAAYAYIDVDIGIRSSRKN